VIEDLAVILGVRLGRVHVLRRRDERKREIGDARPFETLLHGPGLTWIACGAAITLLPILLVAVFARALLGLNYLTLCGLLAGSMTDPPALFFAASLTRTEAPALAYVTVYPLTIILRVLAAQVLVLTLGG